MSNAKLNLEAGLRRLKDNGWVQGEYKTDVGSCLVGSLFDSKEIFEGRATAMYDLCGDAMMVLMETIIEQYPDYLDDDPRERVVLDFDEVEGILTHWNDADNRTEEEVIGIYEKAIASLS